MNAISLSMSAWEISQFWHPGHRKLHPREPRESGENPPKHKMRERAVLEFPRFRGGVPRRRLGAEGVDDFRRALGHAPGAATGTGPRVGRVFLSLFYGT